MALATILQTFILPVALAQGAPDTGVDIFPPGQEDVDTTGDEETRPGDVLPDEERTYPPETRDPTAPTPMGDDLDLPRDDDVGPDFPLPEDEPLNGEEGIFEPEGNIGPDLTPLPAPQVEPDL